MQEDVLTAREMNCVRFAMDVSGSKKIPAARAAHIPDATGGVTIDAENRAVVNAILIVLENLGLTAT